MNELHEALRRWARGLYSLEAGVELLIRACGGRFANSGQPWVQQGDTGLWWIDVEQMNEDNFSALSGGETRLLRIAASLLDGPPVDSAATSRDSTVCTSNWLWPRSLTPVGATNTAGR